MAWQTPQTSWNSTMGVAAADLNRIEGNIVDLDARVGQVVRTIEQQLTATTSTTVATLTPTANKIFEVRVYIRVVTANTNVAVAITYDDAGGAQVYNLVPTQTLVPGSHGFLTYAFNATTAAPINVNVTAGTINQVYATAVIKEA